MTGRTALMSASILLSAGALLTLPLMFIDQRSLLGVSVWLKPFKFFASTTIYLLTVAVLINGIKGSEGAVEAIAYGSASAMLVELALITLQAARGRMSHYNESTPQDSIIFGVMGLVIVVNTVLAAWLLLLYFRSPALLPPQLLWGIRLGLLVFVIGSLQGFLMVAHKAHTVGAPDGSPGVPLMNWSKKHGDLRVAHFLGLHAVQLIPLFGWFAVRRNWDTSNVVVFAALYALMMFGATAQALAKKPFFALPFR